MDEVVDLAWKLGEWVFVLSLVVLFVGVLVGWCDDVVAGAVDVDAGGEVF